MMGGVGSSDLWRNCEQSNAGTQTIGGTLIPKHTKGLLLWPAETDVRKLFLNWWLSFHHWSLRSKSYVSSRNRATWQRERPVSAEAQIDTRSGIDSCRSVRPDVG